MSTSGISSMFSMIEQFQQNFQQLGTDLISGNLSAAQSDFVTLENDLTQTSSTSTSTSTSGTTSTSTSTSESSNPIAQAFSQLSTDLQAGNLTAAQQDYSTLKTDLQSMAAHGHHHHHKSTESGDSQESEVSQLMDQLGQDLQSGHLSSAQSDFSSLQQYFQGYTSSSTSSAPTTGSISIMA
jgi:outer membrane protein assembly factor BamD (BamD/ComL family)